MNRRFPSAFLVAFSACIFFSHSAKPETKQRVAPRQDEAEAQNSDDGSTKGRKERRAGKRRMSKTEQTAAAREGFTLLEPKGPSAQSFMQPLFANRYLEDKKRVNLFVSRIDFTRDGVALFLNQTFNNRDYGGEFLPYSLSHLSQFMEFAHTHKQSPEFIEGALRLFNQKMKNAPFLIAPAVERFMDRTLPYFEQHLAVTPFSLWQESKHLLSQAFREKFALAQKDPLGFFEYISKQLAQEVQTNIITPDRVRATCMRFLSCTTDKLTWSPIDQEDTWRSFKKIGDSFHALHLKKVIPDELDANELYWGLVERYCHFLKLAGTRLSLDTCNTIRQDLADRKIPWLLQKEQESVLETKMERLTVAVLETEAKIRASGQGIITDTLITKYS